MFFDATMRDWALVNRGGGEVPRRGGLAGLLQGLLRVGDVGAELPRELQEEGARVHHGLHAGLESASPALLRLRGAVRGDLVVLRRVGARGPRPSGRGPPVGGGGG